jgi:cell division protein ZapE
VEHLTDRLPTLTGEEIVAHLVPPPQFADATIESYRPDPGYPSQSAAVAAVREFVGSWSPGGLFSRRRTNVRPGVYLDGGFGVGKTHLLVALWRAAPGRKYFGTFLEYTSLVGALGYQSAVQLLKGASLICIDEFELDDPGDTRMMTRLLTELTATGTRIAATSNTPPNALGEGRFAAQDFLREIDALSAQFHTVRIDGLDYRRRDIEGHAVTTEPEALEAAASRFSGRISLDRFGDVVAHLAKVHPSKYVKLVDNLDAVAFSDVRVLDSQTDALRLVALVDRLYDAQVPILASGVPLDQVFADDMLAGGYRKKYLRAISRMIALTTGND